MNKQLFTIHEAARLLGVSIKTLRRWDEKGLLKAQRTIGNQRRYDIEDLEKLKGKKAKSVIRKQKIVARQVTISEAAAFLGISIKTLRRWEAKGMVVSHRSPTNQRFFLTNELSKIKDIKAEPTPIRHPELGHSEFISESHGILKQVQDDKSVRHDNYFNPTHTFAEAHMRSAASFFSILGVILTIAAFGGSITLSQLGTPATKLLSFLPQYMTHDKKTGSQNEVLATETQKHDYRFKISVPVEMLSTASVAGKLTAPNILYSVVAGDNITISGDPQNPTISATVEDLASLGVTAGEGIAIDGTTITNTDRGSTQNIFAKIKVGSETISAGNNTDTFELAAGNNITLSTDTGNKRITISADDSSTAAGSTFNIEEGDVAVSTADTLDFLDGDFDVGESPTGEANIQLASTLSSVTGVAGSFAVGTSANIGTSLVVGTTLTVGADTINDFTGPGLAVSGSTLQVNLTTLGGAGSASSNSGLEVGANGLTLLKGCSDGQILKWDDTNAVWYCSADSGAATSGISTVKSNDAVVASAFDTIDFSSLFSVSQSPANEANISIAADALNFSELSDSLSLDAATTITNGIAGNLTIDLTSTGDFVIADAGTPFFTFTDTGTLTQNGAGQVTFSGNVDATNGLDVTGTSLTVGGNATIDTAGVITGTQLNVDSLRLDGNTLSSTASEVVIDSFSGTVRVADLTTDGVVYTTGSNGTLNSEAQLSLSRGGTGMNITGSSITDGQLLIGNNSTDGFSLAALAAGSGITITNGSGTITIAQTGSGSSKWTQADSLGILYPNITTLDLLVGGTTSSSAKFAVVNVAGGTPVASVSGSLGAAYLTANGQLQTTNRQSLTLGGGNTGSVVVSGIGTGVVHSINGVLSSSAVNLASSDVTGILPIVNGGTGVNTFGGTNTLLYTTSADTLAAITTGNNGVLITSGGGVPSISSTLPTAVQDNITRLGTVTSGIWNGSIVGAAYGGTGADLSGATQYSLPYFSANGVLGGVLAPSTAGYVLSTNSTGAAPSWIPTSSFAINYWDQISGVLTPKIETLDLLLGSQSTTSARFAVTNINSGTPTASLSAGLTGGAFLTASGLLQTTNNQSLTLGGSDTGDITLSARNGSGRLALNVGSLTVNGSAGITSVSPTCVSFTNGIVTGTGSCGVGSGGSVWTFNTTDGTLYPMNSTMDLLIGGESTGSAKFAFINAAGGTPVASVSAGTNGATYLTANGQLQTTNNQSLALGGGNTGDITFTVGAGNNLKINGTSGATVGAATCVTTLNGIVTGTGSCDSPLSSFIWNNNSGAIFEGNTTQDLLIGSSATSSAQFAITGIAGGAPTATLSATTNGYGLSLTASNGTIQSLNKGNLTLGGATTGTIIMANPTTFSSSLTLNGDTISDFTGTTLQVSSGILETVLGNTVDLTSEVTGILPIASGGSPFEQNNGAIFERITTQDLLLGSTATNTAKFAFTNVAGGTPTASISGANNNALSLDATGTIGTTNRQTLSLGSASTGDINFVVGTGNNLKVNGVAGQTYSTATCVTTTNGIVTGTGFCTSPPSLFIWNTNSGAIVEGNTTNDFLLGSVSTASAKFAFTNVAGGTPTASISGTGNNALSFDGNGNLQTFNGQSLSFGGAGTGNIVLDSGNGVVRLADLPTNGVVYTSGGNGTLNSEAQLSIARGGTGTNSTPTSGQLLIGNSGGGYSVANITPGTGISITNASGSITIAQTAAASSKWTQDNSLGILYPNISTLDLLVGGTTSSSAKFAILNAAGNTPVASVAGSLGASYLTSNGQLETTNNQQLTFGGSTTGNLIFSPLSGTGFSSFNGKLGINTTNLLGTLDVRANSTNGGTIPVASISGQTSSAGLIVDNRIGDLFTASSAGITRFTIAQNGTLTAPVYAGNNALLYAAPTTGQIAALTTNSSNLCLVSGSNIPSWVSCSSAGSNWEVINGTISPKTASVLDLLIGGNASSSARFHAFGSLNSGTTPAASIAANSNSFAGLVVNNSGSGDILTASQGGITRFVIGSTGNIQFTGNSNVLSTLTSAATTAQTYTFPTTGGTLCIQNSASCGFAFGNNYWQSTANGTISPYNNTVDLLFGGAATNSASFHLYGSNAFAGTQAVASIGANTSFAGLVLDNRVGDIFTASSSGLTRFTIAQNGTLTAPIYAGNNAILYAGAGTGQLATVTTSSLNQCLVSGASAPSWTSCSVAGSNWEVINGTIAPKFASVLDLLVGGTTSSSARFHVYGSVNAGTTPVASVSGNTGQAAFIVDNRGGEIFTASSAGLTRFTINQNGTITAPGYAGNNAILYAGASTGLLAAATTGSNGLCLVSGASAPSWNTCPGGTTNYWQSPVNGIISPYNTTVDLIFGGAATNSATFHLYGSNAFAGTQAVASIGANTSFAGLVLDNRVGDLLTASSSGQTRFVVKQNGQIGIGTADPSNNRDLEIASNKTFAYQKFNPTTNEDWTIGAEALGFAFYNDTDGAYRMILDEGGNVGIGATDPSVGTFAKGLEIAADGAGAAIALTANAGKKFIIGSADTPAGLYFRDETSGAYRMVIDTNGKIGVNTGVGSVLGTLDVRGNTAHQPVASLSGSTSFAGLAVDNANGDLFVASSSGLNRFVIKQNGNVGIGTTLPSADLHIVQKTDDVPALLISSRNAGLFDANSFQVNDSGGSLAIGYLDESKQTWIKGGTSFYNSPALLVQATTGGAPALKVGGGTTIPIGSTAPTASISANSSFATLLLDNMGSGDLFTASSAGMSRFVITQNGNVGIGTTLPTSDFQLNQKNARTTAFVINSASSIGVGDATVFRINDAGGVSRVAYDNLVRTTKINGGNFGIWNSAAAIIWTDDPQATTLRVAGAGGTQSGNVFEAYTSYNTTSNTASDLKFAINPSGTISTASVSGNTSFAGLVVDNKVGDLFTASASGQNRFVIKNNGNVGIGTTTPNAALHIDADGPLGNIANAGIEVNAQSWQPLISTNSAQARIVLNNNYSSSRVALMGNFSDTGFLSGQFNPSTIGFAGMTTRGYQTYMGNLSNNWAVSDLGTTEPTSGEYIKFDTGNNGIEVTTLGREVVKFEYTGSNPQRIGGGILIKGDGSIDFTDGPTANLDVRGKTTSITHSPVATISGSTVKAALMVDNMGPGDLFTASSSGLTRFTIKQNGQIQLDTVAYNNCAALATVNGVVTCSSTGTSQVYGVNGASGGGTTTSSSYADMPSNSTVSFTKTSSTSKLLISIDTSAWNNVAAPNTATLVIGVNIDSTDYDCGMFFFNTQSEHHAVTCNIVISGVGSGSKTVQGRWKRTGGTGTVTQDNNDRISISVQEIEGDGDDTNLWNSTSGALYPANPTLDLFIGGTSSSSARFHVFGSAALAGTTPVASVSGNTAQSAFIVDNRVGDLFTASSSGLNRFVIKQNGNVGIGLATPAEILHVRNPDGTGSTFDTVFYGDDNTGNQNAIRLRVKDTASGNSIADIGADYSNSGVSGNTTLTFSTRKSASALAEAMRINNNLNIGIGTTTPLATLNVMPSNINGGTLAIASFSGRTSFAALVVDNTDNGDILTASSSGLTRFTIKQNGDIGIGTINPTAMLDVAGTASISSALTFRTGAGAIQTTAFNNLTIGGTTTGNIIVNPRNGATGGYFAPATDNVTDLGSSPSARFRSLYLGPGSLHIQCRTGDGCAQNTDYAFSINSTTGDLEIGINGNANNSNAKIKLGQNGTTTLTGNLTVTGTINASNGTLSNWDTVNGAIYPKIGTQDLLIGGTSSSSARFHVFSSLQSGTTPAASVSANSNSFAGMVVNNRGNGDIFTASRGGKTIFTIGQDRVQIGTGSATGAGGAEVPQLLSLDSKGSTGDPGNGRQGDMYYNTVDEKFRCYEGSGWRDCIATSQSEFLRAEVMQEQKGTEIDSFSDHLAFNVATGSGSSIFLDTSSGYKESAGSSLGRFTLTAGRTYSLRATIPYAAFSGDDGYADYQWYNVTSGVFIGNRAGIMSARWTSGSVNHVSYAEAIITPTQTTVVEVRLPAFSNVSTLGSNGSYVNPNALIQVLSGAQEVAAYEYLRAETSTQQTSPNLDADDRIKLDTVTNFSGTSISLNTDSYANGGGRFTLAAGKTYRITGRTNGVGYSAGSDCWTIFRWYNVTNSSYIGTSEYVPSTTNTSNGSGAGLAETIITPSVTTTIELRIHSVAGGCTLSAIDNPGSQGRSTFAFIEIISDLTKIAQFTGATSSADGALGYVPAPLAGDQGAILLGNGTWTDPTNVKIGTTLTEPIASLSANTTFAGLVVNNNGRGDLFTASSSGLTRFTIAQNGNVRIGNMLTTDSPTPLSQLELISTKNPLADLSADSNYALKLWNTSGSNGTGTGIAFANTSNATNIGASIIMNRLGSNSQGKLEFYTKSSTIIGDAPQLALTLNAAGATASVSGKTGFAALVVDNRGGDLFTASSSGLNRFVIKQNGNVGVGLTNPTHPFQVARDMTPTLGLTGSQEDKASFVISGATNTNKQLRLSYDTTNDYAVIQATNFGTSGSNLFINPDGGMVQIGSTTTPTYNLQVNGTSNHTTNNYGYLNNSGAGTFTSITTAYSAFFASSILVAAEVHATSDQREKNFIDTIDPQVALDAISKLRPLHFQWKPEYNKGNGVIAGFFAQDIEHIIPEAVTIEQTDKFADERSLNYNQLTTVAISALQGLNKKVEATNAALFRNLVLTSSGDLNVNAKNLHALDLDVSGNLHAQNLTLGGTNLNDRLLGLESGVASVSAGFANPLAQMQSQMASINSQVLSLADRVASLEAQLTASNSAIFMNNPLGSFNASSGAELSLDSLEVNGGILTDSLSVLGYTTMNELSVTGSIRTGVLTIKGQSNGGASISTLNGNLRLQEQGFGGVDILAGKVTIDTSGNVETVGEITAKKFNVDTTDTLSASVGQGTIPLNATNAVINTTAVTSNSRIFVTPRTKTNLQLSVTTQTAGTSFKVEITSPAPAPIKFDWWIVN